MTLRDLLPIGSAATFAYSLAPDATSEISARLAHRTGQSVTILAVEQNDAEDGSTFLERTEAATPVTYSVRFPDGHTDTATEDELTPADKIGA